MTTAIIITLGLIALIYRWRARHWRKMYQLALNEQMQELVGEYAKIWAEGYADTVRGRNEWPEVIETKPIQ